jgi:hypothetical protein
MGNQITVTARRLVLTLSVAGIAVLGGVGVAPAASAAPPAGNGPAVFLEFGHGKEPVFMCDDLNVHKYHGNCIDVSGPTRF